MDIKSVNDKISKYVDIDKNQSIDIICDADKINLETLRNALYKAGTVLDQDVDNNFFIANIKSGIFNSLQTLVCVYLHDGKLNYKLYNATGKLDKKSADRVVKKINEIIGIKPVKKKHKIRKVIITIIILLLIGIGIYTFIFYKNTQAYNSWVALYNSKLQQYKNSIKKADVSNIDSFKSVLDSLNLVDININSIFTSMVNGNNSYKIINDIDIIREEIDKLEKNIEIVDKITNPNVRDIESKIKNSQYVMITEIVSDEDKKSEWFNPIHPFKDCIYFILFDVEYDGDGRTPVEKGTDAGGCIEIYETLEDARQRYDYLMSFDNTIYYSGQFIVVGTMVLRTSYKLSNDRNDLIVKNLIKLMYK